MDIAMLNLQAGWIGFIGGAVTGSMLGLFFHGNDWLGGYASFRRRMFRLGHISFFGLGFINILFALTYPHLEMTSFQKQMASYGLISGAIWMPIVCYLSGWKDFFRHIFFIPVVSLLAGFGAVVWSMTA